jgi:hypothetical protein
MAADPLTASLANDLPPYEPQRIVDAPFSERIRLACTMWADSSPNRPSVMALYWGKYFFVLIGFWAFWCSFNAGYPGFFAFSDWTFTQEAFKKAMVWSMAWELFGFGCGWGPMNARFDKWFGGYRHFARPGTIKLPLFRGAPLIGGDTRNLLDAGLYVLNQILLIRVLVAPEVTPELLLPCFVLVAVNGILDKTLFLVARYEHYWVVMAALVFAAANDLWIAGAKLTWSFIWIWAAVSKWNSHFPSVIMFMMNNGPFFPKMLKKSLFKSFPDDLRPSGFAEKMALFGHVTEFAIPFILLAASVTGNPWILLGGCILFTGFHTFIGLNNPNGMPVEWNILMIYGGWFLFWFDAVLRRQLGLQHLAHQEERRGGQARQAREGECTGLRAARGIRRGPGRTRGRQDHDECQPIHALRGTPTPRGAAGRRRRHRGLRLVRGRARGRHDPRLELR